MPKERGLERNSLPLAVLSSLFVNLRFNNLCVSGFHACGFLRATLRELVCARRLPTTQVIQSCQGIPVSYFRGRDRTLV